MDLKKLNSISKFIWRKCKLISELVVNQAYMVEDIRKVTTKYGDRVIIDLQDEVYCYLPTRISKELLGNDQQGLTEFSAQLEVSKMSMKSLPGRSSHVEFIIILPDDDIDCFVDDNDQKPQDGAGSSNAQGGAEKVAGGSA